MGGWGEKGGLTLMGAGGWYTTLEVVMEMMSWLSVEDRGGGKGGGAVSVMLESKKRGARHQCKRDSAAGGTAERRTTHVPRMGREAQERVRGQLELLDREARLPLVPFVVVDRHLGELALEVGDPSFRRHVRSSEIDLKTGAKDRAAATCQIPRGLGSSPDSLPP